MAFAFSSPFRRQKPSTSEQRPAATDALGRITTLVGTETSPELNEALSDKEPLQRIRLVCKEDIFAPNQEILLLKAGQVLEVEQIQTLLKYGISPAQFQFEGDIPEALELSPQAARLEKASSVDAAMDTRSFLRNCHKRIMVIDRDDRSLRRTVDGLLSCGVPLHKIHPIRIEAHQAWAMNKYQPDVIMLDYVLTGNWVHKHDLKERVGDLINHVGKVVLLVRDQSRSEAARDALNYITQDMGIRVIYKPIHRSKLKEIL